MAAQKVANRLHIGCKCSRKRHLAGNSRGGSAIGKLKAAVGRKGGQWSGLLRRMARSVDAKGRYLTRWGNVARHFGGNVNQVRADTCDLTLAEMIAMMDDQVKGEPCQNIILEHARL